VRVPGGQPPPAGDDLAGGGRAVAGQDVEQLVLALALQPGDGQHLAPCQAEGDVLDPVPVGEAAHLERRLAPERARGVRHPPRLGDRQRGPLAEHGGHDPLLASLGRRQGVDVAAVAQHRHPVADLLHLQQPVGDEQHRAALLACLPDGGEHAVGVVGRQRGGDLVQQQQRGVVGQDPCHVEHPQQRQGQRPRLLAQLDAVEVELGEPTAERGRGGAGEPQVLGDRQVGGERRVLEDRRQAAGAGVGRRAEPERPAAHLDHAGVGAQHAAEDLDQRALAGAVGADQPVDLAGRDREVDRAQGHHRPVALGDLAGAEQGLRDRYSPGPLQANSCSGV
jgi:hypothetical protein